MKKHKNLFLVMVVVILGGVLVMHITEWQPYKASVNDAISMFTEPMNPGENAVNLEVSGDPDSFKKNIWIDPLPRFNKMNQIPFEKDPADSATQEIQTHEQLNNVEGLPIPIPMPTDTSPSEGQDDKPEFLPIPIPMPTDTLTQEIQTHEQLNNVEGLPIPIPMPTDTFPSEGQDDKPEFLPIPIPMPTDTKDSEWGIFEKDVHVVENNEDGKTTITSEKMHLETELPVHFEDGSLYVETEKGKQSVNISPQNAEKTAHKYIKSFNNSEMTKLSENNGAAVYNYEGETQFKLFGFINIKKPVKVQINAVTGESDVKSPWWSIFTTY